MPIPLEKSGHIISGSFSCCSLRCFVESDRGKQYVASMYEDLTMDTIALNSIIQHRNRRNEMFDSIFLLMDNPGDRVADLYFYARHLTRTAPILFFNNDRTIQQLKYSGGLRLITNKTVSDSIMIYDKQVRLVFERQESEIANVRVCLPYYYKIFDGRVFSGMMDENNVINRLLFNPALLKFSKEDVNTFLGYCQTLKANNIGNNSHTKILKEKAVELIEIIKTEYHLK